MMAQARSIASAPAAARVQVIAPAHLGATAVAALRARGIDARMADAPIDLRAGRAANDARSDRLAAALGDDVIAWALDAAPATALAVELAAVCAHAAGAGRPVCLLAPPPRGAGRAAIERAAALAYLRAYGAAVGHDVDAWLESVVLLVRFGLPVGPHAAIVAPASSWLEAQASAIAAEAELGGLRSPLASPDDPTDVVLYDPALGAPPASTPGLHVPVAARGELADHAASLYTARAALGAITVLGRAAERIAVGLGPAAVAASAELAIDRDRLARQLAKLGSEQRRVGDHETKVLLAAYGVPITRQAVATTPSAAVKLARRAGYPVELKPFGHDLPSELAGCPVERNVASDAMVRAAFATVLAAAGRTADATGVIIRETPPPGRELAVSFIELPALGWTVVLDAPGQPAAAPAPLRLIDAQALAAQVAASRAGEPDPDRSGLANLLRRASHLVADLGDRLVRLDLPRIVVGGRGARTVVVDALTELR
jgi:hypothetical protein